MDDDSGERVRESCLFRQVLIWPLMNFLRKEALIHHPDDTGTGDRHGVQDPNVHIVVGYEESLRRPSQAPPGLLLNQNGCASGPSRVPGAYGLVRPLVSMAMSMVIGEGFKKAIDDELTFDAIRGTAQGDFASPLN